MCRGYLADKPRAVLYKLANIKDIWERRTAIVATYFFVRKGEVDDTYKIAELLLKDKHDLIHKATGGWLREAGKKILQGFCVSSISMRPRCHVLPCATQLSTSIENNGRSFRSDRMLTTIWGTLPGSSTD